MDLYEWPTSLDSRRVSIPFADKLAQGLTSDGFARDVTLRYTKNFGAKTLKLRAPSDWWQGVMRFLERPYRLVCATVGRAGS